MIRFILAALFVVLFLIFSIPLLFVEWIIGKFNMDIKNRSSLAIVNWGFRVVTWISGVQMTVIGEDNVPKDEPVLYVCNHRSYFDIVLTYIRVPRPTGYIAKKEMLRVPLLSSWMKNLHCQFLDRDNIKEGLKTILHAIELVKSGISICIFPEGTRNKTDEMLPFKEGSLKIAEKSGCAIVPMAITNSAEIFENHAPKIKKCHVILEYGKPFYVKDLEKEQQKFVGAYTQGLVAEMLKKNG
ncbi:MAG TPA: lysophospholipid acyltransferase family protein [Lachnospiraceae bacterium]|jgi:1-acyl-sn-glycerol-3-phosphate acyltransferase|nr:lysophospholipid acyltransferase family protein [Lachnospiraceae bacterium]